MVKREFVIAVIGYIFPDAAFCEYEAAEKLKKTNGP
jgi:hypothetical protein